MPPAIPPPGGETTGGGQCDFDDEREGVRPLRRRQGESARELAPPRLVAGDGGSTRFDFRCPPPPPLFIETAGGGGGGGCGGGWRQATGNGRGR